MNKPVQVTIAEPFDSFIDAQLDIWAKVVKENGIKAD